MSGIAGLFHAGVAKPVEPGRIAAMIAVQAHRGPDGESIWTGRGIGLGHRQLSVIDVTGATQPIHDGALSVTCDGSIYNFADVRANLEAKGSRFRTAGDTEVLLHAWRHWGPSMLDRLDGTFAFAIHDAEAGALFLARDRLGVKPLHWTELSDGSVAFASELKGLLAHPLLNRVPDLTAVEDYLAYGYVPDDACLIAGVRKLPAGHFLLIERGRPIPAPRRYWDVDFSSRAHGSAQALSEELIERTRVGVISRTVADVPLGVLLSGRLDSAAVVALMAEASPRAINTFTIKFNAANNKERSSAALVAGRFATNHHEHPVAGADSGLIDLAANAFDEPFGDASVLQTYRIFDFARERVTVALSGTGADEILAGHRRYRTYAGQERARLLVPGDLGQRAFAALGDVYPEAKWVPQPLRAKAMLTALGQSGGKAYARAVVVTPPELRKILLSTEAMRSLDGYRAETRYERTMAEAPARDPLDRAQYADLKHRLPGGILTRNDRMSMAVGLELREPLIDHRLIEFCATLPGSMRIRRGEGKWLMRSAMERFLPVSVRHPPAVGCRTPIGAWFRDALDEETALLGRSHVLAETGWFNMTALDRIATDHREGRADYGRTLWQFVMLERSLSRLF